MMRETGAKNLLYEKLHFVDRPRGSCRGDRVVVGDEARCLRYQNAPLHVRP